VTAFAAYALAIAGVPYLFTSGPCVVRTRADLTSDERDARPWWFYSADMTVAEGYYDATDVRWGETAKPLDGDLDCDSITFRLHDAPFGGAHLLTQLATLTADAIASSPLAASISASATTCTVGVGGTFTVGAFAWLERECVKVTGIAGNVLTIVRGQLGTRARAHTITSTVLIEVFAQVPWFTRRRVTLWGLAPDGTPHALWAGLAVRAPRLAQDGARFDLPCDALWPVLRAGTVGDPSPAIALQGYGRTGRTGLTASGDSLLRATLDYDSGGGVLVTLAATAQGAFRDWASMVRRFEQQLEAQASARSQIVRTTARRNGATATFQFGFPAAGWASRLVFLGKPFVGSALGSAATTVSFDIDQVPSVGYLIAPAVSTTWCLTSLEGLPSSWAIEVNVPRDGYVTTRTVGLRVAASKELFVGLQALSVDTSDGPRVTGLSRFYPRALGLTLPEIVVLRDPPPVQVYREVVTDHWAYGIRYGVLDLVGDSDGEGDFDWSTLAAITSLTAGLRTARDWIFDGTRTLGSVVLESCLLFGCSPVIRGGRLALWPWRWPRADEEPVTTYTALDIDGDPTWSTWDEGLANRASVKSDEIALSVTIADSLGRYGAGRQLSLELAGVEQSASVVGDPLDFARAVLSRLDLWADPLAVVRFNVALTVESLSDTQQGNVIGLSEWLVPDGAGGRGLRDARCMVVSRAPDLGRGVIEVTALVWPRTSHGYAPCVRIAERHGGSSTVFDVATGYVEGSTTYADTATRGAEHFATGDAVELVVRDTATDTREGATVYAVVTGTTPPTIELDSAPSAGMLAAIDGGAVVDLRAAHFSSTAQRQRGWMFVGDETSGVIDGTATRARRIAP
jgi:hypothetical protein